MSYVVEQDKESIAKTPQRSNVSKLGCILAWVGFLVVWLGIMLAHPPPGHYGIFGTYWESGRALTNHQNPYAVYPETVRDDYSPLGGRSNEPDLNLNPPFMLPYIQALSHLSIAAFIRVWTILTGLCFAIGAALMASRVPKIQARQLIFLLLSLPTVMTIQSGQVYGLLFFFAALAWVLHRRNQMTGAAIAIGLLVAARPTMICWPIFLYLSGHKQIARRAIVTVAVAYLLPLFFYGPLIYRQWFAAIANDPHWIDPLNVALMPVFKRLGYPAIGIVAATAVAIFFILWALRTRPDFNTASGAGICVAIQCAPIGWFSYALFLAPFYVARPWGIIPTVLCCFFLLPRRFVVHGMPYWAAFCVIALYFFLSPITKRYAPLRRLFIQS